MSVVIETTLGDITVDLYLKQRPITCLNFLKLCKIKYYNFNLFHSIRSGFIAQTGDPTGTGSGGQSIFGVLEGPEKRFFSGEKMPKIRHTDTGLLSMVCTDDMMVGSQFFFTLAPDLDSLDGVHCVIGEVTEGHDILRKLNDVICDDTHRPYRDVRITHTVILEDPFKDPPGFRAPSRSPSPSAERLQGGRIAPDEEIDETHGKSVAEVHEILEEKEAKARATILEIIGDLPDADIAPPENVLFVCKLNPVTTDEDLEIIFSRFGKIVSCEVIRDKKTGDSLQYAFIEFSDKKSCEDAYFKMDNVLIDDRRIHVDFSQSVSKIKWLGKGRGVKHISEEELKSNNHTHNDRSNQSRNNERNYNNSREYDGNRENNNEKRRHDDRRWRDTERRHDKHERSEKTTYNRERSRSKRDILKEQSKDDKHSSHKNLRHSERVYNDNKYNPHKEDSIRNRENSQNSRQSPNKVRSYESNYIKDKGRTENYSKDNSKTNERNEKNYEIKRYRSTREVENNKGNMKYSREDRLHKSNEKQKSNHASAEPQTPSPVLEKKNKSFKKNEIKKSRHSKKKRNPSTSSSDSDSTETSSSSSESTSSSDGDKKKKKLKTRKRKYSSSSSSSNTSSSDSSSSTTSSSSSTSSTSSNSNTEKRKRRKKTTSKKEINKSKKKL